MTTHKFTHTKLGPFEIIRLDGTEYFNAAKFCSNANKRFNDWFMLASTKAIINETVRKYKISDNDLTKYISSDNSTKGTYLHQCLFVPLAIWCHVDYLEYVSTFVMKSYGESNDFYFSKRTPSISNTQESPSGIYLIHLGSQTLSANPLYKYGKSYNVPQRFKNHIKIMERSNITNLKLIFHGYVDQRFISKAEAELARRFEKTGMRFQCPGYKELVTISDDLLDSVLSMMSDVANSFGN